MERRGRRERVRQGLKGRKRRGGRIEDGERMGNGKGSGRHFILEHSAVASWKRFKLHFHLDRIPLVMVRGIERGQERYKEGRKMRWLSSTRYSGSTYLVSEKARGRRAGSGRGMVHSGVRPAALRGPRVRSLQLNRPPPATCSTPT